MCCFPYGVYFSKVKRRAKSQSRPLARAQPSTTLVGHFFVAITSILPPFSRFMVESSSGYSDRSIAKIPGRSTASLFSLLFPRPVMMVSVVEIDVSKYCRFLG